MTNKQEIHIRGYENGDEGYIIDLLNLSFSTQMSNLNSWKWNHVDYPTFKRDNVFIAEADGKIVGYRGLYLRDMLVSGSRLITVSMGSTATHPDFRGYGIYSKIHKATLQAAKFQCAAMAITWNSKGSITYNHNLKTGFLPIRRYTYTRIINYRIVLENELRKFVAGNNKVKDLFEDFKHDLSITIGDQTLSIAEILDEDSSNDKVGRKVQISFADSSVPLLLMLKKGSRAQRVVSLLRLVFMGKVKISGSSPISLIRFSWKAVRLFV